MRKLTLIVLLLSTAFYSYAQSVALPQATINPAPLPALENNGTGTACINFAESSSLAVPAESFPGIPNVTISVSLQYVELTNADTAGVTGTLLNYFTVSYNAGANIMTFTQNAIIPGDEFAQVCFPVTVIQNSTAAQSFNGFNANINATNASTNAQGNASVYTFTAAAVLPDLTDDVVSVNEDTPVVVDVFNNDTDIPSTGAITIATNPTNGTVVITDPNGTPNDPTDDVVTYTPNPGYNGPDSFEYQVCDAANPQNCDTAEVVVSVNPIADVVDDIATTNEDIPVAIDVLNNDNDVPTTGTIAVTANPSNGSVVITDPNGTPNNPSDDVVTYTPNPNFNGTDIFDYTLCDANNNCDTATVTVTVDPIIDTIDDVVTTDEDVPVVVPVLNNDNDIPTTGTITITTPATNGTVVITDPNGTPNNPTDDIVTYTPNGNYNGPDTFEYQVCDANNNCHTATVTVTVDAVNDLPVAVADVITVNEDSGVNNIPVTSNDSFGGDGSSTGTISVPSGTSTNGGTVVVNDNNTPNDPTDDTIDYTPALNFNGTDTFDYTITDANGDASTETVTVTVDAVNDLPVAVADVITVNEDSGVNNIPVTSNDSFGGDGPSTGTISVPSGTSANGGTVVVNDNNTPNDPTDDTIDYTPALNFNGTDTFDYTITDSNGDTSTETVTVTVDAVNDLPVAVADVITVNEDSGVNNIPVTSNDSFGGDGPSTGTISVPSGTSANGGTVVVNDNNTPNDPTDDTIDYTPALNFNGTDTFDYTITDANGDTSTETVTVTVDAVNDLPVAVADVITVNEDSGVNNIPVTSNDSFGGDGPSTGAISLPSGTSANGGTVTVDDKGTPNDPTDDDVVYTPALNFNGTDTFDYTITDANGDTSTATVTVTVDPIVDTTDDPVTTDENIPVVVNVFNNDNDVPTTGTLTVTQPNNGTVVITDPNNTPNDPSDDIVTYTPNNGFDGQDTFTYTVCDANNNCDTATVTVTVVATPDYSPTIFTGNTTIIGASGVIDFRVLIGEYAAADSKGATPVELRIAKNSELTISYNPNLTMLNGAPVNNADWVYDGSHPSLHKFIYVGNGGVFQGSTGEFIGINATLNSPASTSATFPLKVTIRSLSGGETNTSNNDDIDYIDYNNSGN